MPGALRKKDGTVMRTAGQIVGDPKGAANARQQRKMIQKQVEKALTAHPCGECRACCTVKAVAEIVKAEGVACPHLRAAPNTGLGAKTGCSIYAKRPTSCREYNCVWRVGLFDFKDGADTRPDQLGVVFDVNDTHEPGAQMLVAREVWPGAIEAAMPLLHELAGRGHVLYLCEGSRRRMMGPEERVKAIQEAARRRLPLVSQ